MEVHSNIQSERGRNPIPDNVVHFQRKASMNAFKLMSSQVADEQQFSDVRDVHSVPDPSLVDRLSESREDMLWQSMVVEGADYKYDRIKRQL
jgi:hypothetical protein